jgi:hypothetical protein
VARRLAAGSAPAGRPSALAGKERARAVSREPRVRRHERGRRLPRLRQLTLLAADIAAVVIVVVSTAVVVVGVLGLFVWAAIQDGRDEAAREQRSTDGDGR